MNSCNCNDPITAQRYYDGELSAGDVLLFEQHLRSCAGCQETLQGWRDVSIALGSLPTDTPPNDLTARFAQKARERQLQSSRRVAWSLLAAASLLLMASLFLVGYTQGGEGDNRAFVAQWEEYVVAQPAVDEEFTDLESRTLVAIHVHEAPDRENRND